MLSAISLRLQVRDLGNGPSSSISSMPGTVTTSLAGARDASENYASSSINVQRSSLEESLCPSHIPPVGGIPSIDVWRQKQQLLMHIVERQVCSPKPSSPVNTTLPKFEGLVS